MIKLDNETVAQAERKHAFSLIILKDISGKHRNEYLLKYDRRWKCYLFIYNATRTENDREFAENFASDLTGERCAVKNEKKDIVKKFSFSDEYEKTYTHTFYEIEFDAEKSRLPDKKKFRIGKDKYQWLSISEMKDSSRIQERNAETVRYVAENF